MEWGRGGLEQVFDRLLGDVFAGVDMVVVCKVGLIFLGTRIFTDVWKGLG